MFLGIYFKKMKRIPFMKKKKKNKDVPRLIDVLDKDGFIKRNFCRFLQEQVKSGCLDD